MTGPIPPELGDLTNLEGLSIKDNQLTGEIPAELGSLANLADLYLGGNQFTGCIPAGLKRLPSNDFAQLGLSFCTVAQPAGVSATRSFSPASVVPGGRLVVTITAANYGSFGAVTETLPVGFTYVSSSLPDDQVNATGQEVRFTLQGNTSFNYTVTAPSVERSYTFSGTLRDFDRNDHAVGGASTVKVSSGDPLITRYDANNNGQIDRSEVIKAINDYLFGEGDPITRAEVIKLINRYLFGPPPTPPTRKDSSVTARPGDSGDLTQITVKFETSKFLAIDESITFEMDDDLGVPSTISASDVSISGQAAASADAEAGLENAAPRSVIVETDEAAERYVITLNIGNMDDSADRTTDKGLAPGPVTVVFRQGAGITNRTEGGKDNWYVKTSAEDWLGSLPCVKKGGLAADAPCTGDNVDIAEGQIDPAMVHDVPWTITLSSYADPRGEEITAVGKGSRTAPPPRSGWTRTRTA